LFRELDDPKSKLNKKQRAILVEIYDHVCRLHNRYKDVAVNCEELITDIDTGSKQIYSLFSSAYDSTVTAHSSLKEAATISQSLAFKTEKLPPLYTELTDAMQTFQLLIIEKKHEVERMNRSSGRLDKFLGCIKLALKVLAALAVAASVVTGATALGPSGIAFGITMLTTGVMAGTLADLWDKVESFVKRGMYWCLASMQYCTGSDLPYQCL
jgi:hypothetical protein